ncbi:LysR family transcriptional regulator [Nonomuraea angiospora]|uniref:DNA-binding transcriptional LysR family regulator n=1 Tax=Nonomuraea angiospora TaxID=46172 RepID=A0ABR9LN53_9ACTN|nr:LysR family transcriptional regulator [Nonomuraea angiospora]MBE1582082.1 DNA-binding transcriptional LysR family regulator [Nonomuraea angiospora]
MELQQMRYVVAVAETANFTRAAERCRVVQSALSHQIARLERELGARLFDRTSRRVTLTPAGEAFLPAARQALDAAERARAEVAAASGELRGRLAIGAIPTVTAVDLPSALKTFHVRHPQVRITLRVGASDELAEQVRQGALDIAFLGLPPSVRPKGVRGLALARGELVAVVAPGHPLAGPPGDPLAGPPGDPLADTPGDPLVGPPVDAQADPTADAGGVDLRRLSDEVFVDFPAGTAARAQSDEAFAAAGVTREVAFEITNADLMARLVRLGLGIALMPAAFAPELPGVRVVELRDPPTRVEHLIWSRLRPSPAAAAFLDVLDIRRNQGAVGDSAS